MKRVGIMIKFKRIFKIILNLEMFLKELVIWNLSVKGGYLSLLCVWGIVLRIFVFFYYLMGLLLLEIIIFIYRVVN